MLASAAKWIVKSWLCVLLLVLHCTTVTVSQRCSEEGDVKIVGIETDSFVAGRLEICIRGIWRAVYDTSWGNAEAKIVCEERGFTKHGYCKESCFGASSLATGYSFRDCAGAETLVECTVRMYYDNPLPRHNAGVICTNGEMLSLPVQLPVQLPNQLPVTTPQSQTSPPPPSQSHDCSLCPAPSTCTNPTTTSTTPPTPAPPTLSCDCRPCDEGTPSERTTHRGRRNPATNPTNEREGSGIRATEGRTEVKDRVCMAVGAALGGVSALLLLILVGVITGWAWSCHRNKGTAKQRNCSRSDDCSLDNPTYGTATPPTKPSVHYSSSIAPQATPTSHHTPSMVEGVEHQEVRETESKSVDTVNTSTNNKEMPNSPNMDCTSDYHST